MKDIDKRNGESTVDWKWRIVEQEKKARERIKQAAPELLAACKSADLTLNECAKHLLGTGPIPEPEAMAITITQVKDAIADATP